MQQAVIVDAIRTPMGRAKPDGSLTELHPTELLAQVLSGLIDRNHLDPGLVDDVITTGATMESCEDALRKAGAKTIVILAVCRTPE